MYMCTRPLLPTVFWKRHTRGPLCFDPMGAHGSRAHGPGAHGGRATDVGSCVPLTCLDKIFRTLADKLFRESTITPYRTKTKITPYREPNVFWKRHTGRGIVFLSYDPTYYNTSDWLGPIQNQK